MCFFGVLGPQNLLPLCHNGVLAIISWTRGWALQSDQAQELFQCDREMLKVIRFCLSIYQRVES